VEIAAPYDDSDYIILTNTAVPWLDGRRELGRPQSKTEAWDGDGRWGPWRRPHPTMTPMTA